MAPDTSTYEFPPFRLEVGARRILRDDEELSLTPKAFDTLALLVRRHGEVVRKQEILDSVWSDTFVEESVLTQNVYTLRRTLGDRGATHRLIATVPRIGYRFVAPVRRLSGKPADDVTTATDSTTAGEPIASLAVLPLQPLDDRDEHRVLGIGLADSLITRLGGIGRLTVRPTSSVLGLPAEHRNSLEAGRALGVEAVVEGRLQFSGDRVRVTVQLVDTVSRNTIWGDRFEEAADDLLVLQESLAERLADALRLRLSRQERAGLAPGTTSASAYQSYLQGQYLWNQRTADALQRAIEHFAAAAAEDPSWALPHAGLAHCHVLTPFYADVPARSSFAEARTRAETALSIEPDLAEAVTVLGYTRFIHDREWRRAEGDLRRALELKPGYATAHHWYAFLLSGLQRFEQAVLHASRAIDLDPLSLVHHADLGWVLYFARQYDEAIEQFRSTLELDRHFAYARIGLAWTLLQVGRSAEAVDEAGSAVQAGAGTVATATWIHALARAGRHDDARARWNELPVEGLPSSRQALALSGMEDAADAAVDALNRAADERSRFVALSEVFPAFDRIREHPGFQAVRSKIRPPVST